MKIVRTHLSDEGPKGKLSSESSLAFNEKSQVETSEQVLATEMSTPTIVSKMFTFRALISWVLSFWSYFVER